MGVVYKDRDCFDTMAAKERYKLWTQNGGDNRGGMWQLQLQPQNAWTRMDTDGGIGPSGGLAFIYSEHVFKYCLEAA